jgi:hypothetical protein
MITAQVTQDGRTVTIMNAGDYVTTLTAQEAYELHQAIGAILSECVQPFKDTNFQPPLPPQPPLSRTNEHDPLLAMESAPA